MNNCNLKNLTLVILISLFARLVVGQDLELAYPIDGDFQSRQFLDAILINDKSFVLHNEMDSLLTIEKIDMETMSSQLSATFNFHELFGTQVVNLAKVVVVEDELHILGIVTLPTETKLYLCRITVSQDLQLINHDLTESELSNQDFYEHWKILQLESGDLVHAGLRLTPANTDVYLMKTNNSLEITGSTWVDQDWEEYPFFTTGFASELIGSNIHISMMNETTILDSDLQFINEYNFNQFYDIGVPAWNSVFFNSSISTGDHQFIQSMRFTENEDLLFDNHLWKIDASGNVADSLFIELPEFEARTVYQTLNLHANVLGLGSMLQDEHDGNLQVGSGLFFATIDTSLNILWTDHFYESSNTYRLYRVFANEHALLGIAKEFSSDNSVELLFVKYDPAVVGLSTNNFSANKKDIQIFPNPASESVKIKSDGFSFNRIEIKNLSGKLVEAKDCLPAKSVAVYLQNFAEGIYFVTVSNDDHREVQKLVVAR
ncbi:T9SS type A sorting domain-containing protein [Halocola ammonii]